jgi:NAD(P)-dependent dehydrogenase (short-subunit alcohol dehydrogenase family)
MRDAGPWTPTGGYLRPQRRAQRENSSSGLGRLHHEDAGIQVNAVLPGFIETEMIGPDEPAFQEACKASLCDRPDWSAS